MRFPMQKQVDLPPRGRAEHSGAEMAHRRDDAVGGEEAVGLVAGPDDVFWQEATVREGLQVIDRAGDHGIEAVRRAHGGVDQSILRIVPTDQVDAPPFPNSFCDPDDVIRKIAKLLIEAPHGHALGPVSQLAGLSVGPGVVEVSHAGSLGCAMG